MKYFRLDRRTVISLTGTDRVTLLQRLCTQDLRTLSQVGLMEGFLTDVKGKTLSHGWILNAIEELLVVVASDVATPLMAHFDRYIIREDVALADQSGDWEWLAIDAIGCGQLGLHFDEGQNVSQANHLICLRCDAYTSDYMIVGTSPADLGKIQDRLGELGIERGTSQERDWLRIQGGWPEFGTDFNASSLPQEVNRDQRAISFVKGCYLGQETVARLDALGQVQKKLCRLTLSNLSPIQPGTKIWSGESEAGWVTSSASSTEQGESIVFAFVKRPFIAPATPLSINGLSASFL